MDNIVDEKEHISVRGRVRRIPYGTKLSDEGESFEMLCVLRNWHNVGNSPRKESELHLIAVTTPDSPCLITCCTSSIDADLSSSGGSLDKSFTSSPNNAYAGMIPKKKRRSKKANKMTFTIPTRTINIVEVNSRNADLYFVRIKTQRKGIFDFDFENANARDALLGFLEFTLSPGRILDPRRKKNQFYSGTSHDDDSKDYLDVEKLTERIAQQNQNETVSERLRKRVGLVVSSFEEISSTLCAQYSHCCYPIPNKHPHAASPEEVINMSNRYESKEDRHDTSPRYDSHCFVQQRSRPAPQPWEQALEMDDAQSIATKSVQKDSLEVSMDRRHSRIN